MHCVHSLTHRCRIFLYESNWRKVHLYLGDGPSTVKMKVQRNDKVLPSPMVEQAIQENCVRMVSLALSRGGRLGKGATKALQCRHTQQHTQAGAPFPTV